MTTTDNYDLFQRYIKSVHQDLGVLGRTHNLLTPRQRKKISQIDARFSELIDELVGNFLASEEYRLKLRSEAREAESVYFEVELLPSEDQSSSKIEVDANKVSFTDTFVIFSLEVFGRENFIRAIPLYRCGEVHAKTRVATLAPIEDVSTPPYMSRKATDD